MMFISRSDCMTVWSGCAGMVCLRGGVLRLQKDVGLSILQQLGFRLGRNQKRISTSSAEIQQTPGGALMFAGDPYFTQSTEPNAALLCFYFPANTVVVLRRLLCIGSREFSMSMDTLGWQSRSSPAASRLGSPFAADRSPERNASGNRMQPATGTSDLLPASVSSNNGPL